MNVHGMKECSRALQERDERQSQASVLIGLTTKLHGMPPIQEFERRDVFPAGRRR